MALFLTASEAFYGFCAVYIACDLGQRMTNAFDQIDLKIQRFHWYLLPSDLKRILPVIIAASQQPVELECFGSTTLSRDVFKRASPIDLMNCITQTFSNQLT